MSGIFPRPEFGSDIPGNVTNGYTPVIPPTGTSALYYPNRCGAKLDSAALNSLISELACLVDKAGESYDPTILCNVANAVEKMIGLKLIIGAAPVSPQTGQLWFNGTGSTSHCIPSNGLAIWNNGWVYLGGGGAGVIFSATNLGAAPVAQGAEHNVVWAQTSGNPWWMTTYNTLTGLLTVGCTGIYSIGACLVTEEVNGASAGNILYAQHWLTLQLNAQNRIRQDVARAAKSPADGGELAPKIRNSIFGKFALNAGDTITVAYGGQSFVTGGVAPILLGISATQPEVYFSVIFEGA